MTKPHIHAEVIKSWADGAEIELRAAGGSEWRDADAPTWSRNYEYRVKPEPKPDYTAHVLVTSLQGRVVFGGCSVREFPCDNLRLIFDGETQKLKSAEVLF